MDKPDAWINFMLGNLEDGGWQGDDKTTARVLGISEARMTAYRKNYPRPTPARSDNG